MIAFLYILLGLSAGILSGLIGIGGGVIIVPSLVFIFKLSQQEAQGTTLAAMVPPIGLLATYVYYKSGFVDIKIALFIAIGFFVGGLIGANVAVNLNKDLLEKFFGVITILIGIKMLFT